MEMQLSWPSVKRRLKQGRIGFEKMRFEFEDICIFFGKVSGGVSHLLLSMQAGNFLDHKEERIKYSDFVHKELKLFSRADLQRSIPSMVDGFKPTQRKVLFSAFKKNLVNEIKVAQFSGYVSEKSAYHHGEQSIQTTIVGMAQNFVGTNNINLLMPNGQFGTRNLVCHAKAQCACYVVYRINRLDMD